MLLTITVLWALLAAVLLAGGIYVALADKLASTTFNLLGNQFTSTSIGVSLAFIGAVLGIAAVRRILKSVDHLAALPD